MLFVTIQLNYQFTKALKKLFFLGLLDGNLLFDVWASQDGSIFQLHQQ